jgi:hypothetical protein
MMFNIDSISTYKALELADKQNVGSESYYGRVYLLDDPAMHADYFAFLEEQCLPLPGQTNSIASASEN